MVRLELSMNIRSNQDYLWLILVVLVMKAIFKVIRVVGIFGVVVSIYLLLVYVPDILNRISDHIDTIARVRPESYKEFQGSIVRHLPAAELISNRRNGELDKYYHCIHEIQYLKEQLNYAHRCAVQLMCFSSILLAIGMYSSWLMSQEQQEKRGHIQS